MDELAQARGQRVVETGGEADDDPAVRSLDEGRPQGNVPVQVVADLQVLASMAHSMTSPGIAPATSTGPTMEYGPCG
jgi:hypothetical protein